MTNEESLNGLKMWYPLVPEGLKERVRFAMKILEHEPEHRADAYRDGWNDAMEAAGRKGSFEFDEELQEYRCSECGHCTASKMDMEDEAFEWNGVRGFALKTPHYCKHCGAYMRGDDDE